MTLKEVVGKTSTIQHVILWSGSVFPLVASRRWSPVLPSYLPLLPSWQQPLGWVETPSTTECLSFSWRIQFCIHMKKNNVSAGIAPMTTNLQDHSSMNWATDEVDWGHHTHGHIHAHHMCNTIHILPPPPIHPLPYTPTHTTRIHNPRLPHTLSTHEQIPSWLGYSSPKPSW